MQGCLAAVLLAVRSCFVDVSRGERRARREELSASACGHTIYLGISR